jgi:putative peptidoglycan lipid II flippase
VGILANTAVLALLLHRRKLVRLDGLNWTDLAKVAITAAVAGLAGYKVAQLVPVRGSRLADLEALGLATMTWAAAVAAGLWITRSELPGALRCRRAAPAALEQPAAELGAGIEP